MVSAVLKKANEKKKKGGLATIAATVFILLLTLYVLTSAIHPSAVAIKDQGQDAGQAVVEEKANIIADFLPTTFVDPTNAGN